jgi:F0F1-type ATP synthase assembly protein I
MDDPMMASEEKMEPGLENRTGDEKPREPRHGLGLLAQVTSLAWDLVVPIVGGVLLGSFLDGRLDGGLTWTLSLLVLGILIAFGNLYNLYVEHGRKARQELQSPTPADQDHHDTKE